uniref:Uncharacterized protein n=1 Tax=Oryza sativa subsp. japonica TaxID=39947 RepID=Q6H600_ORYSJ|nr:hypothetical protein [Oryza sativa Japonica Group]
MLGEIDFAEIRLDASGSTWSRRLGGGMQQGVIHHRPSHPATRRQLLAGTAESMLKYMQQFVAADITF